MSNHPFVHIEFSSNDPAQSAQFYSNLFGWEMHEMAEFNYWTFQTAEGQGGGFNKVGNDNGQFEVKPGDVIAYVNTDDIDRDLAKAQELGATVIGPKMEIPGIGWYGVFRDPTGNMVGLYTGLQQPA